MAAIPPLGWRHHSMLNRQFSKSKPLPTCNPGSQLVSVLPVSLGLPTYPGLRQWAHGKGKHLAQLICPWPGVSPTDGKEDPGSPQAMCTKSQDRRGL